MVDLYAPQSGHAALELVAARTRPVHSADAAATFGEHPDQRSRMGDGLRLFQRTPAAMDTNGRV
jgi:hypothetical protein